MRDAELGLPDRVVLELGRYRHFRGGEYEVLSIGRHTETNQRVVVYRAVDDPDHVWVRPLEMFVETVDGPRGTRPRFAPLPKHGKRVAALGLAEELVGLLARRFLPPLRKPRDSEHQERSVDRPVRHRHRSLGPGGKRRVRHPARRVQA